jgi:hypothetical protein
MLLTKPAAPQCAICFERDSDTLLQPCGHTMCQVCFVSVTHRGALCPFCRSTVKSHSSTKKHSARRDFALAASEQHTNTSLHAATAAGLWAAGDAGKIARRGEGGCHALGDPMNFSDMSDGEHRWFCDIAAQVARAELEDARTTGSADGGFDAYACGSSGAFVAHSQMHDRSAQVHEQMQIAHHQMPNALGLGTGNVPAGWIQQQQQQQQQHARAHTDHMPWMSGHVSCVSADIAAGALQTRGGMPVMGSMSRTQTGLGGVEYTSVPSMKQEAYAYDVHSGGACWPPPRVDEHFQSLQHDANILKRMFGVTLE